MPEEEKSDTSSSVASPTSDSNNSSPRDAPAADAQVQGAAPVEEVQEEAPEEDTPVTDLVDGSMRKAQKGDQQTVYLWSFPHTRKPGKATPSQFSKEEFSAMVVEAYTKTGKGWEMWVCVKEAHPMSKSKLEQEWHFHLVILLVGTCRWVEQADYLRIHYNVYAHVSTASSRNSYMAGVAFVRSINNHSDVDAKQLMLDFGFGGSGCEIRGVGLRFSVW